MKLGLPYKYVYSVSICIFRDFLHYISSPRIALTNPNCTLKTEVVCDRREPTIDITIVPVIAGKCILTCKLYVYYLLNLHKYIFVVISTSYSCSQ